MTPTISVCVPIYEPDEHYLRELISSLVVDFSPRELEIVLSVDLDTQDVVVRVGREFSNKASLVITQNPEPLGMVLNWNAAVAASHADIVVVPGQDDRYIQGGLRKLLRAGIEFEQVGLVVAGEQYINEGGVRVKSRSRAVKRSKIFSANRSTISLPAEMVVAIALTYGQVYADPCSLIFSRTLFSTLGGFSTNYGHAADLEFILRAACHLGQILLFSTEVSERRLHSGNLTQSHIQSGTSARDRHALQAEYLSNCHGLGPTLYNEIRVRSKARLLSHLVYDLVRLLRSGKHDMVGSSIFTALVRELAENLGVARPRGKVWLHRSRD